LNIKNLAVLVSCGGTNLQALLDAQSGGRLPNARVALAVSSNADAYALKRAENAGVPTAIVPRGEQERLLPLFDEYRIDIAALCGYLSILPAAVVRRYAGRVVNVHPSLIPLFCGKGYYGLRVHEAALASGMKVPGATVHLVDEGVDTGKILAQRAVEILPGDTPEMLQKRVLAVEHEILVEVIEALTVESAGMM
jgi:phosphoribosylglycinamide formyltransferase-1